MTDARLLARILTHPEQAKALSPAEWSALLTMAQAERLQGSLAHRLDGIAVPVSAQRVLDGARRSTDHERQMALWEAEMARRVLAPLNVPVVLLKGTAFAAAGLSAGQGRHIGDLDILVPRASLDRVEAAVLAAGWEWAKPDAYDDYYYRTWMHELPPMMHKDRDRMIDIHHTILPLTARPTPDAEALFAASVPLENGLRILCPEDMLVHAVAHLFADGDLAGGLRNLWDMDRMIREFEAADGFWDRLETRARLHGLTKHTARALRLCRHIFETPISGAFDQKVRRGDVLYAGRLLGRNSWGQETRKVLSLAFYVRSHWIRMPPLLLARHLFTKWRKARAKA
jgi:hypothetical protein